MKKSEEQKELERLTVTAKYYNKQLDETYEIGGVNGIAGAWRLSQFVCNRMGWNHDMFCDDVLVRVY